jgi:hypothetical protein
MVPANCFRSPWNWHKFYAVVAAIENRALVTGLLRHEVKLYFTGFVTRQIRNA